MEKNNSWVISQENMSSIIVIANVLSIWNELTNVFVLVAFDSVTPLRITEICGKIKRLLGQTIKTY